MGSMQIKINKLANNIVTEGFRIAEKKEVTITDIHPILLNKSLKYPEQVYTHFIGAVDLDSSFFEQGVSIDLFHIPQNLLGVECSRTHVYTSENFNCKWASIVEVVKGSIAVILQKNATDDEISPLKVVADIKIIQLRTGEKLAIPSGYMYSFVNIGEGDSYFYIMSRGLEVIDYETIKREKGLAVFIISKNSKIEVAANPKYKIHEYPQLITLEELKEDDDHASFFPSYLANTSLFAILKENTEFLQEYLAE
ncbi:MAG: hypothetical protein Kow0081_4560 [Candidatus Dojkabacteria bacterium]